MHDPDVVAFTIRRPWPQRSTLPGRQDGRRWAIRHHHDHTARCRPDCPRQPFPWWRPRSYGAFWRVAGRAIYWPALITIWHREPRGHDSGTICPHYRRWRDEDGPWQTRTLHAWRWHVHHWHVQVHPAQHFRRWALTRCAWCGGRSVKGDQVNVSRSWDGPRGRWWQGEPGLYHGDCSGIAAAHAECVCTEPAPEHGTHGRCLRCGKHRAHGRSAAQIARLRELAAIPEGQRPAAAA